MRIFALFHKLLHVHSRAGPLEHSYSAVQYAVRLFNPRHGVRQQMPHRRLQRLIRRCCTGNYSIADTSLLLQELRWPCGRCCNFRPKQKMHLWQKALVLVYVRKLKLRLAVPVRSCKSGCALWRTLHSPSQYIQNLHTMRLVEEASQKLHQPDPATDTMSNLTLTTSTSLTSQPGQPSGWEFLCCLEQRYM